MLNDTTVSRKGAGRGIKITNEYARLATSHIDAPKAVWIALAMSLAIQLRGGEGPDSRTPEDVERAATRALIEEWGALYRAGIVPQRPPRGHV